MMNFKILKTQLVFPMSIYLPIKISFFISLSSLSLKCKLPIVQKSNIYAPSKELCIFASQLLSVHTPSQLTSIRRKVQNHEQKSFQVFCSEYGIFATQNSTYKKEISLTMKVRVRQGGGNLPKKISGRRPTLILVRIS